MEKLERLTLTRDVLQLCVCQFSCQARNTASVVEMGNTATAAFVCRQPVTVWSTYRYMPTQDACWWWQWGRKKQRERLYAIPSPMSVRLHWKPPDSRRRAIMALGAANRTQTPARPEHRTVKLHQASPRQRRLNRTVSLLRCELNHGSYYSYICSLNISRFQCCAFLPNYTVVRKKVYP